MFTLSIMYLYFCKLSLILLCFSWLSGLENTKWLHHIANLLKAACIVANAIHKEGRPVLVHCSDGWDRTPQIVALAELLLDPYYRTSHVCSKSFFFSFFFSSPPLSSNLCKIYTFSVVQIFLFPPPVLGIKYIVIFLSLLLFFYLVSLQPSASLLMFYLE